MNRSSSRVVDTDFDDESELVRYLDLVLSNRWLVVSVAAIVLAIGTAYAFLASPIYESNILIQVEESPGSAASLLGDISSLFDVKTEAAAEIEILGSRMVVDNAVENLRLYIDAKPSYFPLIGATIASRADRLPTPGLFGIGGFCWGTESIDVDTFDVPSKFLERTFKLTVLPNGRYRVDQSDLDHPIEGEIGKRVESNQSAGSFVVKIAGIQGVPGAAFKIVRYSKLKTLEKLQKDLTIEEVGKQSNVISASLQGKDPDDVANILNTIGSAYVAQNIKRKSAEAEKSLAFLEGVVPKIKRDLELSETRYNAMRNRRGTFNLGIEAQAYLQDSVTSQAALLDLQQKRAEAATRFADGHPAVQALDRQIANMKAKVGELSSRMQTFPNVEQDELRLMRDVQVNNDLYIGMLNNVQQLKLVAAGKVGNVREVDNARVPEEPVKPRKPMVVVLSAIMGLMLGVIAAVAREALYGGVMNSEDIERNTGLSVYGTIPFSQSQRELSSSDEKHRMLLADESPHEPSIESLRSFRTALGFATLDAENNRLLLTGPSPGVGKSFIASNLAAVIASGGRRVLLVDADMRRGHLHEYMGVKREGGLSDLLSGQKTLPEVIHRNVSDGLDFISTGAIPPQASELLLSERTIRLFDEMSASYDLVILDTPPVLAVSDTSIIAPHCATTFLVARFKQTTISELTEAAKMLDRISARLRGVVFNGVDARAFGYRSKYGAYRYVQYDYASNAKDLRR
ncbi:tyrosine protein kinase [Burkholderia sp. A9]|uniref:polysaccharide biosynthesis tyrosine autokinase n=1 Tax=Burkholderia sp. A9 TaxID=1365108 RepID=UPI0005757394|nr:polysaccharide biosynthesis tyrosine autokinase [Burkholderia sp. A9]KHK57111.1 tyrosine protein kinase [Burkholderia sp. A9]